MLLRPIELEEAVKLKSIITGLVILVAHSSVLSATSKSAPSEPLELPPIETFGLGPFNLENISIWVPAAKCGPVINRACQPKMNCVYSTALPAGVRHTKMACCPDEIARLLAEYAAPYHEQGMPLTTFNGWQWEYSYSICQFESVTYDLMGNVARPFDRRNSYENSWEAILTQTVGSVDFQWARISESGNLTVESEQTKGKSDINVWTFSSMRVRDGYPKRRHFE